DDDAFARTLLDLVRERGFKGLVALGGAHGLELARTFKPDAITLDLQLPDMDGWVLLDQLKHDPETRHIPVHIISVEGEEHRGLEHGAIAVLQKPADKDAIVEAFARMERFISKQVRRLLVVEDDEVQRQSIVDLIGNGDVETIAVESGEAALEQLGKQSFDCMVLDLKLPGMSGV